MAGVGKPGWGNAKARISITRTRGRGNLSFGTYDRWLANRTYQCAKPFLQRWGKPKTSTREEEEGEVVVVVVFDQKAGPLIYCEASCRQARERRW